MKRLPFSPFSRHRDRARRSTSWAPVHFFKRGARKWRRMLTVQCRAAADRYRTVVRKVDHAMRTKIEGALPFKIHFEELGPHNLFVALRRRRPVGLLYERTEEGDWGLAKITGRSLSIFASRASTSRDAEATNDTRSRSPI